MRLWLSVLFLLFVTSAQADGAKQFGVFGVVERLSPLTVNGQEIVIPDEVPIISLLGQGQKIGLGDTLALRVTLKDDVLTAVRVLEVYPVIGPISGVEGGTATVMGSPVYLPPDASVRRGQWVAVSGFWSGEKVITTRLQKLSGGWFGHLTGVVDPTEMRLGGSELRNVEPPTNGFGNSIWMLSGGPQTGGLDVRLMAKGVFGGAVEMALWQGHASLPIASQTYLIYGSGIIGTAQDAQMPVGGSLIRRCAQNGRVLKTAPEGLEDAFGALGCAIDTQAE
ncbi:hypothetical protein [Sulfitobacter donghicola]|uniref:DUF5666 domain-containing protein n=1 Tax=Sulfitobacter donghicola DSW-25 = KCTC 12864 = JCM 14565 TaxID=1300350 RepID=A0A073IMZ2_9RHOB|nr:hypothetical protein [Sulfitobacter donghicola]KEJ91084.1 hypothetical protein DSW25_02750 [Sulfitobacter donghicola DSW-25 = KCTC 12864 = JCM 14565]KIN68112.1 hypothetical protein Z948_1839 [Sulfitobacter donghicola DSW-25 = KCTC 12864 = JCM 14565]